MCGVEREEKSGEEREGSTRIAEMTVSAFLLFLFVCFSFSRVCVAQADSSASSTPSQAASVSNNSFADLGNFGMMGSTPENPLQATPSNAMSSLQPAVASPTSFPSFPHSMGGFGASSAFGNPTPRSEPIGLLSFLHVSSLLLIGLAGSNAQGFGEDFTAFSSSQPTVGNFGDARPTTPFAQDDDFGDFSASTAQPKVVTTAPVEPLGLAMQPPSVDVFRDPTQSAGKSVAHDDDFGDFTPAQSKPTSTQEDDFGDFTPTQSKPQAVQAIKLAQENLAQSIKPAQPQDDDFGDFTPAVQPKQLPQPAKTAGDDDDFGDFTPAVQPKPKPTISQPPPQDDDFGDFTPATQQKPTPPQPQLVNPVQDDDFGDFSPAVTSKAAIQVQPKASAQDDFGAFSTAQEEDFGDFTPAEQSKPQPTKAIADDFGDFATAPAPSPQIIAQKNVTVPEPDDFGDFTPAASHPKQPLSTDDDFGDFTPAVGKQSQASDDFAPTQSNSKPGNTQNDDEDFADFTQAPQVTQVAPTTGNPRLKISPLPQRTNRNIVAPTPARRRSLDFLDDLVGGTDAPLELGGLPPAAAVNPASLSHASMLPAEQDDFGSFSAASQVSGMDAVKPGSTAPNAVLSFFQHSFISEW